MKRLAKLRTEIENDNYDLKVLVYDDESKSPNTAVMWLSASLEYENGMNYFNENHDKGKLKSICVDVIDFNNDLYFAMPEARQRVCGSQLLKKFIRYYNSKYGKNTENWVPVYATFANYELQEQFKAAVDAGIFPPESKDMIEETTEENYKKQQTYNMNNRRVLNDMKENPKEYFKEFDIFGNYIINPKFSQIEEMIDEIRNNYGFELKNIEGIIEGGDLEILLPTSGDSLPYRTTNFYYELDDRMVVFQNANSPDDIRDAVKGKESIIESLFDVVDKIAFGWYGGETITPQELFRPQEQTASSIVRRLIQSMKR